MKSTFFLVLLMLFVSCGKSSKKSKSYIYQEAVTFDLYSLQSKGIYFYDTDIYGRRDVRITCQSNYFSTNQHRLDALMQLKASLGIDPNGPGYTLDDEYLTPTEMARLLDMAINNLSYSTKSSTICPTNSRLATLY